MTSVDEILYAPITPVEEPQIIEGLETVSLADLVDQGAEAYYRDWHDRFALANVQGLGSLANLNAQLQGLGQNLNHLHQAQSVQGLGSLANLAQVQGLGQNFNHLQQAQNLQSLVYQRQVKMPQGWQNPTTFEQAIRQIEALIS